MRDFTLHDVLVEPGLNTLTRAGKQERLPAKFVDLLVALAESPGQVVGKAELLTRVWGDGDTDEKALAHAVWVLRKALNDDASSPRFIATVPRRGYRLLAPVVYPGRAEPREEPAPAAPFEAAPREMPRAQAWWTPARFVGVLLAIVVAAGALTATMPGMHAPLAARDNATWAFRSAGDVLSLGGDAATLLVGDESGFVYALDTTSGRERWRFPTQGPVYGVPRLADGAVYAGSDDGYLYALDALSGHERWRLHIGARILTAPAVDADGNIVFGANDGEVTAVAAASGERRWSTQLTGRPLGALLLLDDAVVLRLGPDALIGLDRRSGAPRWRRALDREASDPVALDAAHVAIAGFDGGIAVFDANDGSVVWQQPVARLMQRPVADRRGVVVLNELGEIASFAAGDGHLQWRRAVALGDALDPVAWRDWVIVATSRDRLAFLDRFDGRTAATLTLPFAPTQLAATADGLRVALQGGMVRGVPSAALVADLHGELQLADKGIARASPGDQAPAFHIVRIAAGVSAPKLLWRVPTQGFVFYLDPIDRTRIVVGDDRNISLLDAANGTRRWQFPLAQPTGTEPVYDAGVLFVGSRDHRLHALDATSGHELWAFATGGGVLSMPALADGRVFFGSRDKNFYALNRHTGAELWRFTTAAPVHGAAAVGAGLVVFGSGDRHVYALDQASGALRWRFAANDWVVATPLIADGVVYIGDSSGVMHALDLADGDERWHHNCGKEIWFRSAADAERLYFGCGDGYVYALDIRNGEERWRYRTRASATGGVALRDGVLYAGSSDHSLYALDADRGKPLWRLDTGGQTINPQVADGRVYVPSADQFVYAMAVASGKRE